jgi:hypothetical protein
MTDNSNDDEMDCRCPRKLKNFPDAFCPLAVLRLKALRIADYEPTEDDESKMAGCPWAVSHQLANYCFFKYMEEFAGERQPSDVEIASLNCISLDTVKKVEKTALAKIRASEVFKNLKTDLDGDSVVEEHSVDDDYKIYR